MKAQKSMKTKPVRYYTLRTRDAAIAAVGIDPAHKISLASGEYVIDRAGAAFRLEVDERSKPNAIELPQHEAKRMLAWCQTGRAQ